MILHRTAATARGYFWLLCQSASSRIALLLGQIALARLLTPRDFGTVSLVLTLWGVVGALTASGVGDALIQRGRKARLWLWPGLLFEVGLGHAAAGMVLAAAPFAARSEERRVGKEC